ncbi:MAG: leucine-rich repeat domain-containing protein [Tannerellaceae bacterium]|jgi:Leucine-rich repeat (LRR) protein|nr:leucine-rich repeat domain-containing protein [Tannerellaceae bacterium]
MENILKKYLSWRLAWLLSCFFATPAFPATGQVYNPSDVAVVNAIIEGNGLRWAKAPSDGSSVPADWEMRGLESAEYVSEMAIGVMWSTGKTNRRVIKLYVCNQDLTGRLDVSGLGELKNLDCFNNQLTELNISGLKNLEKLSCSFNQLTELDVARHNNLYELSCGFNELTRLDVSELTALTHLSCFVNQLTELDVSRLTLLTGLFCSDNQLTNLDVSRLDKLERISCGDNKLTELNFAVAAKLASIYCPRNQLTELNLSDFSSLYHLDYSSNQLTELHISGCPQLEGLHCPFNQLTELDVANCPVLLTVSCGSNQLTELNISNCPTLSGIECSINKLTELDVSGFKNLNSLSCSSNQLTELDVAGLSSLTFLICSSNQLTELDLSGCAKLDEPDCNDQKPILAMKWNGTTQQYDIPIALNNPTGLSKGFGYSGGKLMADNNSSDSTTFTVETGLSGKTLSGVISLTYSTGSANERATVPHLKAVAGNGSILVSGVSVGDYLRVYSISGKLVYMKKADSSDMRVDVERGIYIVASGKMAIKVQLGYGGD